MEAMRKTWTDDRLDHFALDVDRRFDEVSRRFDAVDRRFDKVEAELHRINDRLDSMGKALIYGAFSFTIATLTGYGAMIALVTSRT